MSLAHLTRNAGFSYTRLFMAGLQLSCGRPPMVPSSDPRLVCIAEYVRKELFCVAAMLHGD